MQLQLDGAERVAAAREAPAPRRRRQPGSVTGRRGRTGRTARRRRPWPPRRPAGVASASVRRRRNASTVAPTSDDEHRSRPGDHAPPTRRPQWRAAMTSQRLPSVDRRDAGWSATATRRHAGRRCDAGEHEHDDDRERPGHGRHHARSRRAPDQHGHPPPSEHVEHDAGGEAGRARRRDQHGRIAGSDTARKASDAERHRRQHPRRKPGLGGRRRVARRARRRAPAAHRRPARAVPPASRRRSAHALDHRADHAGWSRRVERPSRRARRPSGAATFDGVVDAGEGATIDQRLGVGLGDRLGQRAAGA